MSTLAVPAETSRRMPPMTAIAEHWHKADVFPGIYGAVVGWGEPFCFRCGWLTPVPTNELPKAKTANPFHLWKRIGGWLERAHLHDRRSGGPDSPENIVPLCAACHYAMPTFTDGSAAAVAWVTPTPAKACDRFWQFATEALWGGERFVPYPGWHEVHALRLFVDESAREMRRNGTVPIDNLSPVP